MRLEQLNYFIDIARRKSINLASEKLHIAQQTLSRNIKQLEDDLGVVLFSRHAGGIELTEAGKDFLPIAKLIVENITVFKTQHVSDNHDDTMGNFELYTSPTIHSTILPEIIAAFCKKHPGIAVKVFEHDSSYIWSAFMQAQSVTAPCRIAITNTITNAAGDSTLPAEKQDFRPFMTEKFLACVSPQSAFARYKLLSAKTLLKQPIVCYFTDDKDQTVLYQLLKQYGNPRIALSTYSPQVYMKAIAENVGTGFLPQSTLDSPFFSNLTSVLHTVQIKEDFSFTVGYLLPKEYRQGDITDVFVDFLNKYTL